MTAPWPQQQWGPSAHVAVGPAPTPARGGTIWVVVACLSPILAFLGLSVLISGVTAVLWLGVLVELGAGFMFGLRDGRSRTSFAHGRVLSVVIVALFAMGFFLGYGFGFGAGHLLQTPAERERKKRAGMPAPLTPADAIMASENPYLGAVSYAYHDPRGGGGFLGWDQSGHMLTAPPRQALLVIGPPGSAKTTSIIIPSILVAPGACVTTSPKAELLLGTYQIRGNLGRSWQFDPSTDHPYAEGVAVARWSPLVGVHDWDSANLYAVSMAEPYLEASKGGNGGHFIRTATEIIGVLFYAAHLANADMGKVYLWVSTLTMTETQTDILAIFFENEDDPGAKVAAGKAQGHFAMGIEELSKYVASTTEILEAYKFLSVQRVSERPNFDPYEFVRSRDTLHICVPDQYQKAFAPVVTGLVEAIKNAAYELHDRRVKGLEPKGPHVTYVLDEVTNIAPIPLPRLVSQAGGQGLHIIAAMQSNTQAIDRWGDSARDMISMFPFKVILRGTTDLNVLEALSSIAGNYDRVVQGYSESTSYVGAYNVPVRQQNPNWSLQRTRVLEHSSISNPPQGYAVMFELSEWKLIRLSPVFESFWATVLERSPHPALDSSQPAPLAERRDSSAAELVAPVTHAAVEHAASTTSPQQGGEFQMKEQE